MPTKRKKAKPAKPTTGWMFVSYSPNTGTRWAAAEMEPGDYHWTEATLHPLPHARLFLSPTEPDAKECARQFRNLDKHLIQGFAYIGPPGPVPPQHK